MKITRRNMLKLTALGALTTAGIRPVLATKHMHGEMNTALDRVFICNEDSNTMSVIDPNTNTIETTINLTKPPAFSRTGAKRMGSGPILRARDCTSPMSKTNYPAPQMRDKQCVACSTPPTP